MSYFKQDIVTSLSQRQRLVKIFKAYCQSKRLDFCPTTLLGWMYIGKTINGVKITESGLLAGAHLLGAGGLSAYLKSDGKAKAIDRSGTHVSKYLEQFADYDISEITTG